MEWLFKTYAFILGSMLGSLANVLILRIPIEKSVVLPSSCCPSCNTKLRWYMNIPLISFLVLRAKCAFCKKRISWQYPLVEIICALFAVWIFPQDLSLVSILYFLFYLLFFVALIVHLFIDLKHQILPDSINLFLLSMLLPFSAYQFHWQHWVLGAAIGFVGTYFVTWLFYKIKGQIGLGGGDIKLFGVLGLFLGPYGIVQNIFTSCLLGSIIGLILLAFKKLDRNTPLAFGPFIIIVAIWQIYLPELFKKFLSAIFYTSSF